MPTLTERDSFTLHDLAASAMLAAARLMTETDVTRAAASLAHLRDRVDAIELHMTMSGPVTDGKAPHTPDVDDARPDAHTGDAEPANRLQIAQGSL